MVMPIFFLANIVLCYMVQNASSFAVNIRYRQTHHERPLFAVDKLREGTGIRPSLHPTTINAVAEALKLRVTDPDSGLRPATSAPIEIAMAAGRIAANFLAIRRETSTADGMTFTEKEEQTIAGRVVGVVMRLDELGSILYDKTIAVAWIKKYNEWASFGVLEDESQVEDRIKDDPLFTIARAECLLALFLHNVEEPTLLKVGENVPGGSKVDFLDADRIEVLLGDFQ